MIMWRKTHEKRVEDLRQYFEKMIADLSAKLKKAERNDTPKDPKTGKFKKK